MKENLCCCCWASQFHATFVCGTRVTMVVPLSQAACVCLRLWVCACVSPSEFFCSTEFTSQTNTNTSLANDESEWRRESKATEMSSEKRRRKILRSPSFSNLQRTSQCFVSYTFCVCVPVRLESAERVSVCALRRTRLLFTAIYHTKCACIGVRLSVSEQWVFPQYSFLRRIFDSLSFSCLHERSFYFNSIDAMLEF